MERKQAMPENLMLSQVGTWQACVQALHAHLHAHASDQCLLWVNPAQIDLFADNAWVQENRVRVPIQHERFDVQFAPYLLALELTNSSQADIFEQSVQAAYEAWALPCKPTKASPSRAGCSPPAQRARWPATGQATTICIPSIPSPSYFAFTTQACANGCGPR
jgi:hypothetical protein